MKKHWKVREVAELAHVTVRTLHHYHEIGLLVPSERSDQHVARTRATYTFTPRAYLSGLVQYNPGSDSFSGNFRLRWEWAPGTPVAQAARLVLGVGGAASRLSRCDPGRHGG